MTLEHKLALQCDLAAELAFSFRLHDTVAAKRVEGLPFELVYLVTLWRLDLHLRLTFVCISRMYSQLGSTSYVTRTAKQ